MQNYSIHGMCKAQSEEVISYEKLYLVRNPITGYNDSGLY